MKKKHQVRLARFSRNQPHPTIDLELKMKILAFNGSPRMDKGNTDRILQPFLEGMRDAGATTVTLYLKKMKIKPCQGCYSCHWLTPGECKLKDDMQQVLPLMDAADIIVFASPLYVFTVSSYMKVLLDRLMVLGDLKLEFVDNLTVHPPRNPERKWKWILVSNAGFPEQEHFDPMVDLFRRFARAIGGGRYVTLTETICKSMGELLAVKPLQPGFEWFFQACRKAGREVVEQGAIQKKTRKILDRPLLDISPREFVDLANANIEKAGRIIRERNA